MCMLEKFMLNTSLGQHRTLRPSWIIDNPAKKQNKQTKSRRWEEGEREEEKEGEMKRRRVYP